MSVSEVEKIEPFIQHLFGEKGVFEVTGTTLCRKLQKLHFASTILSGIACNGPDFTNVLLRGKRFWRNELYTSILGPVL